MEKSWNCVFEFLWEPWYRYLCSNNCFADDSDDDDDDDDDDDNDKDEEEDSGSKKKEEGPKSYYLRQNKPRTHFYNVPVEGMLFWNQEFFALF